MEPRNLFKESKRQMPCLTKIRFIQDRSWSFRELFADIQNRKCVETGHISLNKVYLPVFRDDDWLENGRYFMEQKTKSGFSLYVNSNENIQNALFLREKKKKYRIGLIISFVVVCICIIFAYRYRTYHRMKVVKTITKDLTESFIIHISFSFC